MPKKKRFDKKNATHFTIVHRSQRDITEDEEGRRSEFVLVRQDGQEVEPEQDLIEMDDLKNKLADLDILADDDEYDYSQHYRSMGAGDFLNASDGKISDQRLDERAVEVPVETIEVERMLESINLNPKFMDEDIHDALFNFEEGDFEEILDDFCVTAAQAPEGTSDETFDYDAHIQAMIEKARASEKGENSKNFRKDNENFFDGAVPLGRQGGESDDDDDDDDDNDFDGDSWNQEYDDHHGASDTFCTSYQNPKLSPEEDRALLEKFEQTLAEYDSDEVGDLYEIDEEIINTGALDVFDESSAINGILDSYLKDKNDDQLFEGIQNTARQGGSGYSYLVKGKMVRADQVNAEEDKDEEPIETDEESVNNMMEEMEPPAEEILIDGKSYFTERSVNPWDCESILSTYSTLDNNPAIIGSTRHRKKKAPKGHKLPTISNESTQILLSNKTGLPMGVLPVTSKLEKSLKIQKEQVVRRRGETKEERKARKEAAKQTKQEARLQKKMLKGAFAEEFAKRSASINADDVGCVPVFRYS